MNNLGKYRKAIVSGAVGLMSFLGVLATQVFTSGTVNHDLTVTISGLGVLLATVGVSQVTNDPTGNPL